MTALAIKNRDAPLEPGLAIDIAGLGKDYRLYGGAREILYDKLGLDRLFRRDTAPRIFRALDGIDLKIAHGERCAIVGRNGAGKTTLLKMILGAHAASRGTVRVDGTIQALMQVGAGFFQNFTGRQNIKSALLANGVAGRALDKAMDDVIAFSELGDFLDQPARTYSLGMLARTQFAVATAIRPDILIVDEILGAGDAYFSAKSAERMRGLARSGCTLLMVSHAAAQLREYCERAVWLDGGKIRMSGDVAAVLAAYGEETERRIAANEGRETDASRDAVFAAAGLPPRFDRPFIAKSIRSREPAPHAPILRETIAGGAIVEKRRERDGLRIAGIGGRATRPNFSLEVGEDMDVTFDVEAAATAPARIRAGIYFFMIDGHPVGSCLSPEIDVPAVNNGKMRIEARFRPLLLGAREYIVSFALFDATDGAVLDVASRALLLGFAAQYEAEPPWIHHQGRWRFDNGPEHAAVLVGKQ